jgi:predicted kinase
VPRPRLIVVTGPPASGKSGLARDLARRLAIPILEKDTLKERLYEVLGHGEELEPKLEEAALALLFSVVESQLRAGTTVLVESNFDARHAEAFRRLHREYPHDLVQVHCAKPPHEVERSFAERSASGRRHPGHGDEPEDAAEVRRDVEAGRYDPLEVPGELLRVDPEDVDLDELAGRAAPGEASAALQ